MCVRTWLFCVFCPSLHNTLLALIVIMCACACIYARTYVCTCVRLCVCLSLFAGEYTCTYVHICVYVCMYVCTYVRLCVFEFLGAACGSPYIVFISTSGMLRSSDIYIYIYIYIYNTCSYA